ncbi:winged helix-turn-helix domain-containing protein [Enterococcus rotai]|uniref:winged helix-turn-helix domain-containing protein n=1 Tax=Enterococcus rotai TaxID=118060 RepID=UPI0035C69476
MFTIGYLAEKELQKNAHLNFLTNKCWTLAEINLEEQVAHQENLDAIIIFEDTMSETCFWLMKLKKQVKVPVFLLSAIDESRSNIVYLQLGAQACFSMKMEAEELYYTLTNLLSHYSNKSSHLSTKTSTSSKQKEIELIPRNLSVLIDGIIEVALTKKEYHALEMLYNNPGQTISYNELKEKLWNSEMNVEDKNYRVANIMFHLRNKIEISVTNPRFIKTVRSKGYMLDIK